MHLRFVNYANLLYSRPLLFFSFLFQNTKLQAIRSGATQALADLRLVDVSMSPIRPIPFVSASEFAAITTLQHKLSLTTTKSAKDSVAASTLASYANLHATTQSTIDGLACLTTLQLAITARIAWIAEVRATNMDSTALLANLEWFGSLLEDPHRSVGAAAAEGIVKIIKSRCMDSPIAIRDMSAAAIASDPVLSYVQSTASSLLMSLSSPKHSARLRRRRALYIRMLSELLPFCASVSLRSNIVSTDLTFRTACHVICFVVA